MVQSSLQETSLALEKRSTKKERKKNERKMKNQELNVRLGIIGLDWGRLLKGSEGVQLITEEKRYDLFHIHITSFSSYSGYKFNSHLTEWFN